MPASSIEATTVDFILPAGEIGQKLIELAPTEIAEKVRTVSTEEGSMSATGQTFSDAAPGQSCPNMHDEKIYVSERHGKLFRKYGLSGLSPAISFLGQTSSDATLLDALCPPNVVRPLRHSPSIRLPIAACFLSGPV
jgi:hypothetical protein